MSKNNMCSEWPALTATLMVTDASFDTEARRWTSCTRKDLVMRDFWFGHTWLDSMPWQ